MFFGFLRRRGCADPTHDHSPTNNIFILELYLSKEQIENLHDFEEECMEELFKNKDKSKSIEERIKISSAK